ncbi:hypothetical protein QZM42_23235 [Burkholderia vietnamiensis]|uniref:hypothetical protein n=1 Tax=Burkholderia vietnamiensis TaxID=60552 RepID=UPI002650406C|nr:hypothetical protein [Burkholderia vietnamiensis]MDN7411448.1 hypothetical protein [Burkholderia vietnamiensis]
MAIFVEGYTELLFIDKLIHEIAAKKQLAVQHRKIRGGGRNGKVAKRYIELQVPAEMDGISHYVLIVDCGGEDLVAQRVREEHASLTDKGYEKIIGIRDVFPNFTQADVPALRRAMQYAIKTKLAPVQFVLSVMEIEAWFLSEHFHFPQIDPTITVDAIQGALGFNPMTDNMSDRSAPADDMIAAYQLGGKVYTKGSAEGTINALDYDHVYIGLRDRIPDLNDLLTSIDTFLA